MNVGCVVVDWSIGLGCQGLCLEVGQEGVRWR